MNTLCISNRPNLTNEDLQIVLRDATGLKALYILEDPKITVQGMSTLLDNCDVLALRPSATTTRAPSRGILYQQ